jgi:MFS family permease
MNQNVKASSYRWVILAVYMLFALVSQIQWLTHAAVVRPAEVFYSGQFNQASFFNIDFLAMAYMILFLIMSFPASYVIDTFGIKIALTFGAVLLGIFSITKAIFAASFLGVVISQIGLAIAQPFIINAVTALTVRWFPLNERGLAAGFATLAQFIGILIAMLVTPLLVGSNPDLANYGTGFEKMLWVYGILSLVSAILIIILIKEHPEGSDFHATNERKKFTSGVLHILQHRDMRILMLIFLIGLGLFNAISSMTDSIAANDGVKDSDGLIGGLMLIGGIIGAIIIPILSDYYKKRKLFLVICIAGMTPGVFGLAFFGDFGLSPSNTYTLLLVASFIVGFFIMSAGPIGFQYAAEVSYPAPESASQGMMLWVGQLSGIIFVSGMSVKNNFYLPHYMTAFAFLSLVTLVAVFFLHESPMINIQTGEKL